GFDVVGRLHGDFLHPAALDAAVLHAGERLALARLDVLGIGDDARVVVDQDLHPVLYVVHAVTGHAGTPAVYMNGVTRPGGCRAARMSGCARPKGRMQAKPDPNDNRSDARRPSLADAANPAAAALAAAVARG